MTGGNSCAVFMLSKQIIWRPLIISQFGVTCLIILVVIIVTVCTLDVIIYSVGGNYFFPSHDIVEHKKGVYSTLYVLDYFSQHHISLPIISGQLLHISFVQTKFP